VEPERKKYFARKVAANFDKTTVITVENYLKGTGTDGFENVGSPLWEKYNARIS